MDAAIMVGSVTATGLVSDAREVGRGFNPRLSPDGNLVAFLQRQPDGLSRVRLIVTDLRTGVASTVSEGCPLPVMNQVPVEWVIQSVVWSPDSASLFFSEWKESGSPMSLHEFRPKSPAASPALVTTAAGERVREVALAPGVGGDSPH
jgi:hypothetical protein